MTGINPARLLQILHHYKLLWRKNHRRRNAYNPSYARVMAVLFPSLLLFITSLVLLLFFSFSPPLKEDDIVLETNKGGQEKLSGLRMEAAQLSARPAYGAVLIDMEYISQANIDRSEVKIRKIRSGNFNGIRNMTAQTGRHRQSVGGNEELTLDDVNLTFTDGARLKAGENSVWQLSTGIIAGQGPVDFQSGSMVLRAEGGYEFDGEKVLLAGVVSAKDGGEKGFAFDARDRVLWYGEERKLHFEGDALLGRTDQRVRADRMTFQLPLSGIIKKIFFDGNVVAKMKDVQMKGQEGVYLPARALFRLCGNVRLVLPRAQDVRAECVDFYSETGAFSLFSTQQNLTEKF